METTTNPDQLIEKAIVMGVESLRHIQQALFWLNIALAQKEKSRLKVYKYAFEVAKLNVTFGLSNLGKLGALPEVIAPNIEGQSIQDLEKLKGKVTTEALRAVEKAENAESYLDLAMVMLNQVENYSSAYHVQSSQALIKLAKEKLIEGISFHKS